MHLLIRTQERFSRGSTVDADERGRSQRMSLITHLSVELRLEHLKRGLVWHHGVKGVLREGTQHGSFCYRNGDVSLYIEGVVDG